MTPSSILWNLSRASVSTTQNQWWGTTLLTPPVCEPVTLEMAKAHLRVDFNDEDDLINAYITAARSYLEDACGRRLITQIWNLYLQQWPAGDRLFVPYPPLIGVATVQYTDATETVTTVDPSLYVVNNGSDLGEVVLRFGQIWPPTVLSPSRPIGVTFTCGYGEDPGSVPAPLVQALLLLIGHWYQNREAVVIGRASTISTRVNETVDALIARYKIPSYSPDPLRP